MGGGVGLLEREGEGGVVIGFWVARLEQACRKVVHSKLIWQYFWSGSSPSVPLELPRGVFVPRMHAASTLAAAVAPTDLLT